MKRGESAREFVGDDAGDLLLEEGRGRERTSDNYPVKSVKK